MMTIKRRDDRRHRLLETHVTTRQEHLEIVPDLGVLSARLFLSLQDELWRRLGEQGFDDLRPRHGAVLAYLTREGIRAIDLARLSGQHKQIIGTIVDELESLNYVERRPDPADRRAKLVFPTERGTREIEAARRIIESIENEHVQAFGSDTYASFIATLHAITKRWRRVPGKESDGPG